MTTNSTAPDRGKSAEALVTRLSDASLGMFDVMAVYLGDRLGLYRALRDDGPATSADLADRAGIDERYAREWLEQQAAGSMLEAEDVAGTTTGAMHGSRATSRPA